MPTSSFSVGNRTTQDTDKLVGHKPTHQEGGGHGGHT